MTPSTAAPALAPASAGTGAFERLARLLAGVEAPGHQPMPWHLGEFRTPSSEASPVAQRALAALAAEDSWERYPPLGGTPELRAAFIAWLRRRFGVDSVTGARSTGDRLVGNGLAVEPAPGAKQAIAVALSLAIARARSRGESPVVLVPAPFYPTYVAAAKESEVRFYRSGDVAALAATLRELPEPPTAVVVCHPSNPEGTVLDAGALRAVSDAVADERTLLLIDECYVDLWLEVPAPGLLAVARNRTGPYLVVHSLSKRSGMPGLRQAFVTGDPDSVAAYAHHNRVCGVSAAVPVCEAATILWGDETHVAARRAVLARHRAGADAVLGSMPGYRRPDAGFFLWIEVPDDEVAARELWRRAGIRVMPGRYLSASLPDGSNPGVGRIRLALVHPDTDVLRAGLLRARAVLEEPA